MEAFQPNNEAERSEVDTDAFRNVGFSYDFMTAEDQQASRGNPQQEDPYVTPFDLPQGLQTPMTQQEHKVVHLVYSTILSVVHHLCQDFVPGRACSPSIKRTV